MCKWANENSKLHFGVWLWTFQLSLLTQNPSKFSTGVCNLKRSVCLFVFAELKVCLFYSGRFCSAETWGLQCFVEQNVKIGPGQLHFSLRGRVLSPWAALHLPQLTLTPPHHPLAPQACGFKQHQLTRGSSSSTSQIHPALSDKGRAATRLITFVSTALMTYLFTAMENYISCCQQPGCARLGPLAPSVAAAAAAAADGGDVSVSAVRVCVCVRAGMLNLSAHPLTVHRSAPPSPSRSRAEGKVVLTVCGLIWTWDIYHSLRHTDEC